MNQLMKQVRIVWLRHFIALLAQEMRIFQVSDCLALLAFKDVATEFSTGFTIF
jgi:hypothetical protein